MDKVKRFLDRLGVGEKAKEKFLNVLWAVFHAVEDDDWGRIEPVWFERLRMYVADFDVPDSVKEDLVDFVNSLERFCRLRNSERAFWIIARIFFEMWLNDILS